MSETINAGLVQIADQFKELQRQVWLQQDDYRALLTRYDDAIKRLHDMQAELEYLRREVNRQ